MNDATLVFVVLGAVFAGVLFTLLVQVGTSIRAMTRDAREATRRVSELAALAKPIVARVDRLSRVVEESESDVRTLQGSLHKFAEGTAQLTEGLTRVSGWVSIAAPIAMAAAERFMHDRAGAPADAPHPEAMARSDSRNGASAAETVGAGRHPAPPS